MVSEENSLRIENLNEKLHIDAEVELYFFFGMLKIASGRILADVSVHSMIDVGFGTQPAVHDEKTGVEEGSEMAPAVTLNVLALDIDVAKSDFKVKGLFLSLFRKMILKDKSKIFSKIID